MNKNDLERDWDDALPYQQAEVPDSKTSHGKRGKVLWKLEALVPFLVTQFVGRSLSTPKSQIVSETTSRFISANEVRTCIMRQKGLSEDQRLCKV